MKRAPILAAVVGSLLLAACGGGGDDREDAATGAGGAPTTTTMAGMTGGGGEHAEHGGTPTTCSPSGPNVSVVASGTKFNSDCLAAPADQPFTLTYDNRDSTGHNIVILESHAATEVMFRADILAGPKTSTFNVPALRPGTFAFHCEVHPSQMRGTFVVK